VTVVGEVIERMVIGETEIVGRLIVDRAVVAVAVHVIGEVVVVSIGAVIAM